MTDGNQREMFAQDLFFPTPIYKMEKPEFLENVLLVADEALQKSAQDAPINELYPVVMSGDLQTDARIKDFMDFVGQSAWNILESQGYAVEFLTTYFDSIWCQEHHKFSSMEQHVHGNGVQLVGFYFLECPEHCSRPVFHDPRPAKVHVDLHEQDSRNITLASKVISVDVTPGTLILSNAWFPHSFTRNGADTPTKFLHFNLSVGVNNVAQTCDIPPPAAEVV